MLDVLPDLMLRHRHARSFARLLSGALVFAIVVVLAKLIWLLVGAQAASLPDPEPLLLPAGGAEPPPAVARWHLFGNATPALDPRTLAQAAPDTTLTLQLSGIVAVDDPKLGYAIVVDANGQQRVHNAGDEIAPGVTVDGVYPDRVMLSRGGALE